MYVWELDEAPGRRRPPPGVKRTRQGFSDVERPPQPPPPQTPPPPRPRWCCPALLPAWDFLWLYLETSSIHGFNHFTARRRAPAEYVLWAVVLVLGLTGAVAIGLSTWERYQDNPTVISMERDSHEWNTSFPAATICPTYKYDPALLAKATANFSGNRAELQEFLIAIFESTYETFEDFEKIKNYFPDVYKPRDYLNLSLAFRFDFSYDVVNSVYGQAPEVWSLLSEMGLCYSYNTAVAYINDPDVWSGKKKVKTPVLTLSGHALDGAFFAQMMNMNTTAKVYIHGQEEIPDSASRHLVLPDGIYKTVEETALALYTTQEARELSVHQRRCRFPDESNLELSAVYSYNLCRIECRMRHALRLCGCVPFFYRNTGAYKVCGPKGMICLGKNKENLVRLIVPVTKIRLNCKCLPVCDNVNFVTEMTSDLPWLYGSNFKWVMPRFPDMRLKRDVLFGFTDVLVSVGGTAGLFLGCSLLSFIEIIYFFTLHLYFYIVDLKRK